MKARDLDAVIASAPLNSTAARVVSRGGEHYEPPMKLLNPAHSETPLPIIPSASLDPQKKRVLAELLGRRFGRLTVLGFYNNPERIKSCSGAAYVVRCQCGRYETRTRKGLVSRRVAEHGEDRCSACWAIHKMNWHYEHRGGRPIEDFTARGFRY